MRLAGAAHILSLTARGPAAKGYRSPTVTMSEMGFASTAWPTYTQACNRVSTVVKD